MARHATREVATCLRDGSAWAGRFVVDGTDLDFGDDRFNAAHGLAHYVGSEGNTATNVAVFDVTIERLKLAA